MSNENVIVSQYLGKARPIMITTLMECLGGGFTLIFPQFTFLCDASIFRVLSDLHLIDRGDINCETVSKLFNLSKVLYL